MRVYFEQPNKIGVIDIKHLLAPIFNDTTRLQPRRTLNCVQCGQSITSPELQIVMHHRHIHICTNPHGITYRIGCFREAPGVYPEGPPSHFHTWFAGYQWQVERCRQCHLHMGWNFTGEGGRFYGLILAHLVEMQSDRAS